MVNQRDIENNYFNRKYLIYYSPMKLQNECLIICIQIKQITMILAQQLATPTATYFLSYSVSWSFIYLRQQR